MFEKKTKKRDTSPGVTVDHVSFRYASIGGSGRRWISLKDLRNLVEETKDYSEDADVQVSSYGNVIKVIENV